MKPKDIKKLLFSEINSVSKKSDDYCISSGKDFTRKRKLPFETVIKTIIGMESKSMTNELI
ncbi:IS4 family transposase, partial [Acinetobacter baumannii]|nr:IS4 family transposase [Acinetobacter baumannii]